MTESAIDRVEKLLKQHGPHDAHEVSIALSVNLNTVRGVLGKLYRMNRAIKVGRGVYADRDYVPPTPTEP